MDILAPRDDDPRSVFEHLGPVPLAILREAVESGWFNYRRTRDRDPEGHLVYTLCTKANMVYDHVANVLRELVTAAGMDNLSFRLTANLRSTEVQFDPFVMVRVKRTKSNRGGRSTSYPTGRQGRIKGAERRGTRDVPGQVFFIAGGRPIVVAEDQKLWLTVGFDLDEVEEAVSEVTIGVELEKGWVWKAALPEADLGIIGSTSSQLADRIRELREIRSA